MLKISKTILVLLLCGIFFINVKAESDTTSVSKIKTDSSLLDTAKKFSKEAPIRKDTAINKVKVALKHKESVFKKGAHYLRDGFFFLSGGVCIMLIWLIIHLRNRKRSKKMNSQFEDEYLNRKIIAASPELKELRLKISEKDKTLKISEDRINDLIEEVKLLKEKILELERTQNKVDSSEEKPSNLTLEQYSSSYLYFPSPLSDGSFRKIDGRTSFSEGASIYRFKLTSETDAYFEFCEDSSSVSMALNNRNDLILSVAEEMEGHYAGARKVMIYQGKMGRVQLVDNKWLLVQKAQIKYV